MAAQSNAQQTFEEIVAAVKQAESRGKRYAADGKTLTTSPKGALGEMQVMPKTITDPGFGVIPAKSSSPDEIARVGRDYLQAMLSKYGDTEKALVAYNWGPGATDKWLASGAKPEALPAETRTYVQRVKGLLGKDVPRETMAKKEREPLPASLPPMAEASPTKAPAATVAMASGKSLPDIKSLPASYQAAFALAALADAKDDEKEYDENKETESEKLMREYKPVNHLASLDLSVTPITMADGGEVGEDLTKPSFGNPNIRKQGEAARRLAAMRDVNTLPDPKTYAVVSGLTGTRPDQMGFSVLHPKANEIRNVANPAFAAGTALQMAPAVQALGGGKAAKMLGNMAGQEFNAALMGERPGTLLDMFTAPAQPKFMFVRARPEAAARHADLQAQGLSPEQIRAQNLTLVDNRGNLIEEISDAPAVLQQKTASVQRLYYDMLKHPELESIYPGYDMPFVQIGTTRRKDAPLASASFGEREGIQGTVRSLPGDDVRGTVRGTLLHEGQHAIQSMEGFTEGANPSAFVAYIKAKRGIYHSDPTVNENVIREMERAYPNLPEVTDRIGQELKARYGKVFPSDKRVGEALYRHMPGEVQADLARIRGNLTPEELKATPLEASMQQLNINPANILQMSKSGSRPDRQIGDLEYDVYGYADGGPVYRAGGSPMTSERKLDRETITLMRGEGMQPEAMTRVRPPLELNPSAAGLPGLMMYNDPSLPGTGTAGYVMVGDDNAKNPAMAQAMFLNPKDGNKADTIAHETEHLLARQNLGRGSNINTKFDELIGDNGLKRIQFVQKAVQAAPYLKEKYGLQSAYFQPEMVEFQGRRAKNLLYEQLASLAALEQRHKVDLTKDEELRKTLFARPDVRETYNALTGLRQTRLDPRDLPPHTRVPEPGMLDAIKKVFKRADGGPVYRADGSPEEGERLTPQQIERIAAQDVAEREAASTAAFIAQKSGIGRKAGPVSQALQSGQGQIEFLKGMTNVPQNILGAPMDISNMIANVYGGGVDKPFMGSEYLKEKSRAAGLGFKPSTDPTLAGFYGAGDLGSNLVNPAGVTRTGVKAAEKTGEAAKMLARDFQQYNQNLAVPGASYAIRNRGTPFLNTPPEINRNGKVTREAMGEADDYADWLSRTFAHSQPALKTWLRDKVGAYLRRDFGTESDQMVQAADAGKKLHFMSPKLTENVPHQLGTDIGLSRELEGFPKAGFAKTPQGQKVEEVIDSTIYPLQLQDINSSGLSYKVPKSMQQFVDTNPEMRVSQMGPIDENLKFDELAQAMEKMFKEKEFRAYGESVPMPKEYILTDETLQGLTPAQASNRVANKMEWADKKRAELAGVAIAKDPRIVSHSYDNGSKWISPADLADNPNHAEMVKDIGCAGGWCTNKDTFALDYGSGDNRLNILLDKKFEPRVQITVNNPTPSMRDFATYMSEMGDNSVATKLQTSNYGWNTAGGRNSVGVDALVETELKAMPEYQNFLRQNQATKHITEIKGQFNNADLKNSPYLKQIQDFVKRQGPELQSVDNLDGIKMVDARDHKNRRILGAYVDDNLLNRFLKINGNSYYADDNDFIDIFQAAKAAPNNAARQIQMNFFEPPAEKAYGGMIERQPTDNRRYL